jgi:hypothetical protein
MPYLMPGKVMLACHDANGAPISIDLADVRRIKFDASKTASLILRCGYEVSCPAWSVQAAVHNYGWPKGLTIEGKCDL